MEPSKNLGFGTGSLASAPNSIQEGRRLYNTLFTTYSILGKPAVFFSHAISVAENKPSLKCSS